MSAVQDRLADFRRLLNENALGWQMSLEPMPPPPGLRVTGAPTEADTCRLYVVPKLQAAGWETEPHSIAEQRSFTNGRIIVAGTRATRLERKKADYLLRYTLKRNTAGK